MNPSFPTLLARLLLGAALTLGVVHAGDPETPALSEAQASKALAKFVKQHGSAVRKGAKQAVLQLELDLADLEVTLADEELTIPAFAIELLGALESYVTTLTGHTTTAAFQLDAAARGVLEQIADQGALPASFQVGAGGVVDRFATQVARAVAQSERKADRMVARFRKRLAQLRGWSLNVQLEPTRHTQPLAPVFEDGGVSPVNFPFALEVLFALSDPEVDDDGVLGFALLAPANEDDELASILIGPEGLFEIDAPWIIDEGGRTRGLLGTGEGLAETSYRVVLDRFGTQVSRSISVP